MRVRAAGQLALLEERGQPVRLLHHRAQHVERGDVARALPDRVERGVAVEPRHARLLDVAVAAQALERLDRVLRRALADPVLLDRGREAAERRGGLALVVGARDAHGRGRRGLGVEREVGEHVLHQRLVGQQVAERRAVAGVVERLDRARAHAGGRADQAVEPGVVDHPDDRLDAAALLADQACAQAVVLDLGGGERARAELVLQPLDAEPGVARLEQEAREAGGRLRERQEDVARRDTSRTTCGRSARRRRRRRARPWSCSRARRSRPASRSSPCRRGRPPRSPASSAAAPTRPPGRAARAGRG